MRAGSLFAGYGGLTLAVQEIFDAELAWYADCCRFTNDGAGHHDPCRAPCTIMAHHWPDVPNLGDVTSIDWKTVPYVDVLDGGSPCQDLSHAGRRQGMTEGTRSNLWVAMREAVATIRPRFVVWENVLGALSARADSDLEPCQGCMGDPGQSGTVLRALGRVVGDLSTLGYDTSWTTVRAADVGAPHNRRRVFLIAADATSVGLQRGGQHGMGGPDLRTFVEDAEREGWGTPRDAASGQAGSGWAPAVVGRPSGVAADCALMPTPRATDGTNGGPNQRGSSGDLMLPSAVALLPSPQASEGRKGTLTGAGREGHQTYLSEAIGALLPTPTSQAAKHGGNDTDRGAGTPDDANLWIIAQCGRWGDYAAAIHCWETALGRPAPAPTQPSSKGAPQLSARFVEWLMGLPAGWVTDVPGITRNQALKALGNGVVPQQATAALRALTEGAAA